MIKRFGWILVMGFFSLSWVLFQLFFPLPDVVLRALLSGGSIVAAAFLLSWAAEAAEKDCSGPLVLAMLALIVMLPEYAVDMYLAWAAGRDITFAPYAMANMSGANRLLSGLGLATVAIVFFARAKKKEIQLSEHQRLDCVVLFLAIVYAMFIVLKGFLAWWDTVVFGALYLAYLWQITKLPLQESCIIGPAQSIADLPTILRRIVWSTLIGIAAYAIFMGAEPFAHSLLEIGDTFHIEKFLLVQWLAPLASESPEFIVAILFAVRFAAHKGVGMLVSTLTNQWTVLVGTIPLVFVISAGAFLPFPLDQRQRIELALAAAQSLFAISLLVNLRFSLQEALFGGILFLSQFAFPAIEMRIVFIVIYIVLALWIFTCSHRFSWKTFFQSFKKM